MRRLWDGRSGRRCWSTHRGVPTGAMGRQGQQQRRRQQHLLRNCVSAAPNSVEHLPGKCALSVKRRVLGRAADGDHVQCPPAAPGQPPHSCKVVKLCMSDCQSGNLLESASDGMPVMIVLWRGRAPVEDMMDVSDCTRLAWLTAIHCPIIPPMLAPTT